MDLATFLRALGIAELGKQVSGLLAQRYHSLAAVLEASEGEIAVIHSIGPAIAKAVVDGLCEARPLIAELVTRIEITNSMLARPESAGPLAGRTFVFTGTLSALGRKDAAARVQELGGRVLESVNASISYVVLGAAGRMSSKEKAAPRLVESGGALRILSEAEVLAMTSIPAAGDAAVAVVPESAE